MLAEERRQRMVEMVGESTAVSVSDLARAFDTSESTIRRDLERLDASGRLVKVHGGATSVESAADATPSTPLATHEPTMAEKRDLHAAEKHELAAWAASSITSEDFVYLDAGTTTQAMIALLDEAARRATFVTNSVSHALALAALDVRTIVIGGDVKGATEAIVGPGAIDALSGYNFTKGFWGTNGVTPDQGFTTPDPSEAMVKRVSMERTTERFVLADPSKLGAVSPVMFAPFSDATLVTCAPVASGYAAFPNVVEVSA